MSLTTRIQDQKDHITQVKKDLCSKVGVPSEPLPSFSEIMGSVPSPSLSDIIKFDIPETYQDGISYNFQAFNRPWVKICGPNQLITEINYTSSRNYFTLEAIHNLITGKTKTRVSQPSPSVGGVADPKPFRSYHSKYYMEIYDPDSFEVQLHVLDHTKEVPEVVHRTTYSKNRAFLGYADGVLDAEGNFWFWDCKLVSGNMDLYYWSGKLNENGVPTFTNNGTRWEKVSIVTSTGAWDPHLYVDFDENKEFLYVLSDRFNYKWDYKTSQLISDGFSTDWVGQSVNKYWVGILRKTDETNNKDYRIIITVFFKIQLAIKYTYWHGMIVAKGIEILVPCIQIMLLAVVIIFSLGFSITMVIFISCIKLKERMVQQIIGLPLY